MSSLIVEVCRILDVNPHPNADRLDIVTVKGWNCIVGRGQFHAGDPVVFIPPDCVLPADMIEKYNLSYLKKNGRTGTVKLRGYLSQGLVLPVDFPASIGENLANYFGITKYEPPEAVFTRGGNQVSKKKVNPLFARYTDIENIKNFPDIFAPKDEVVVTEKLHGTNARFGVLPIQVSSSAPLFAKILGWVRTTLLGQTHEFVWGSHNVQKGVSLKHNHFYGEDVWGATAKKYNLMSKLPEGYIFYGEIVGAGIQDLSYGMDAPRLFIFDIKNVETGEYLDWDLVEEWCYHLDLLLVPLLFVGTWDEVDLEYHTGGQSTLCPSQIREGCVVKMYEEASDKKLGRKILKSVSNEYLLRKNGTEYK